MALKPSKALKTGRSQLESAGTGLLRAMHRCTSFKTIDRDLDVRHNCIAHAP